MRRVEHQYRVETPHMVGDGFRVLNYIPGPRKLQQELSPFLLLDYNPPHYFPPSSMPRGVDIHPHKGFETVTIVFEGELAHKDSAGGKGTIGTDEVQWMTAGSGVLHEEFQTPAFSSAGGMQHMLQLWVNLPARHKGHPPRYQALTRKNIPIKSEGESSIRILAGTYEGITGPAETFSPLSVLDVHLAPGRAFGTTYPKEWNVMLLVIEGELRYGGDVPARAGDFLILDHLQEEVIMDSMHGARVILLAGEPLGEPIAAYGPFVMNTQREIMEAIEAYQQGAFG